MDKQIDLISRLQDEADLCRNDGATDIAALLDEAATALQAPRPEVAGDGSEADAERFRWLAEHTVATGLARWVHPFQFLGEAVDARRKLNRPPTQI